MTDEKEIPDTESPEAEAEGPVGGERLAEARRAKQISVLEIAKELHVEEAKIRALENNKFDELGAPVFAKGHLKKYSQLVGVDHDDVLADYYSLTRSQEMPPVVVKRQKPKSELSPGPWMGAVAVLVVLALAYWLLVERPFSTPQVPALTQPPATESGPTPDPAPAGDEEQAAVDLPAEEPVPAEEPAIEPAADETPSQPVEDEAAEVPAEETIVEQQSPQAAQVSMPLEAGGDDVRLSVTVLGDCWTEITDANGRRLFSNRRET